VHDFSPPDDSSDDLSGSSLSDDSASDGLPGPVGSSSLHPWPRIYHITGVSFASGAPWPSLLEHGGDVRWADHYGLQGTPVAPHAEKFWRRPAKPRHLLVPCPIHSSFLADVFDPVPQVGARGVPNGRLPFSHVPHNVQQPDPIASSLFHQRESPLDTSSGWSEPEAVVRLWVYPPDPFLLPVVEKLLLLHRDWDPMNDEASLIYPSADDTSSTELSEAQEDITLINPAAHLMSALQNAVAIGACNVPTISS
jgi:hypothetical protein